jgi:replicative DNA helicase
MPSFAQSHADDGLPASIHTEIAVLGAMLLDAVAINDAVAKLIPEDFSLDSHQRVYRAMISPGGGSCR